MGIILFEIYGKQNSTFEVQYFDLSRHSIYLQQIKWQFT